MAYLLDVIGGTIIAGLVILAMVALNANMDSAARNMVSDTITQSNATITMETLEYDMLKVGYRAGLTKVSLAESTQVKFFCDLDNNGTLDSIRYYLKNALANNKVLARVHNTGTALACGTMTGFKLTYYDSLGIALDYGLLKSSALTRSKIKSILAEMKFKNDEDLLEAGETAKELVLQRFFKPRNL